MNPKYLATIICLLVTGLLTAQTNDTPESVYRWKSKRKTELQPGYVVLRSGKKLEGQIALNGPYSAIEEIEFVGDGKEITFPIAALISFGLNAKAPVKAPATASIAPVQGLVSDSPEELYEWNNGGVIMNKVVTNSTPREGYVITKEGKKVEGMLRVQRRDDELWNFQIKNGKDKQKFKAEEVSRYGLSVNASEIEQANLAKLDLAYFPGTIFTETELKGKVGFIRTSFKVEKVILETSNGTRSEYTTANAKAFTITQEGELKKYIPIDEVFIWEEFNGNVFQLYQNPNPTTINRFATSMVKTGVEAGTQAAAEGIVKKDAKDNNYVTNLDSVIRVSTKEELVDLRNKLLQISGYSTVDEMDANSTNESLKNTVNAIDLAIAGKEFAQSEGGIYNKEWIIYNKNTQTKTVVYKSDYKDLISPLLFGCYEYLSLDKAAQKEHQKWKNLNSTLAFLDKCY